MDIYPCLTERPCFRSYYEDQHLDSGLFLKSGLYFHDIDNNQHLRDERIFDYIRVEGMVKLEHDQTNYLMVKIKKSFSSSSGELLIPFTSLFTRVHKRKKDWLEVFSAVALEFDHDGKDLENKLLTYLKLDSHRQKTFLYINKTGWYEKSFVLPDETLIPPSTNEQVRYQFSGGSSYSKKGELSEWQNTIGQYAINNPLMIVSILSALTAPLLRLLGENGGGMHFFGNSTSGKTLMLSVAASCWGKGTKDDDNGYVLSWSSTANGFEVQAKLHNDTLICLDEAHLCDGAYIKNAIYALSDGKGKVRATEKLRAADIASFKVFILSSGEKSLSELISAAGGNNFAGQEVRILNIRTDEQQHGVFNDIKNFKSGKAFAEEIQAQCKQHYGHVGYQFVKHLITADKSKILAIYKSMLDKFDDENPQKARAAKKFACLATAGFLAIEYKLLPWTEELVMEACLNVLNLWQGNLRLGFASNEDKEIFDSLYRFIELNAQTKLLPFPSKKEGLVSQNKDKILGYYRPEYDSTKYYLYETGLSGEIIKGFDIRRIIKGLKNLGLLIPKDNRVTINKRQYRFTIIDHNELMMIKEKLDGQMCDI